MCQSPTSHPSLLHPSQTVRPGSSSPLDVTITLTFVMLVHLLSLQFYHLCIYPLVIYFAWMWKLCKRNHNIWFLCAHTLVYILLVSFNVMVVRIIHVKTIWFVHFYNCVRFHQIKWWMNLLGVRYRHIQLQKIMSKYFPK